jgi:perosamine synthetase
LGGQKLVVTESVLIQLAKPDITDKAINRVVQILKSGHLVQGEQVRCFETGLREYLGSNHAILVSSGTAALHLSLIALNIGPGDEVIVPAFTFPATANVVEFVGAKPVFVDIGLSDFCIDVQKIQAKISSKTKAIIPVHEFGQPADMEKIASIAELNNLKVIEDAACALGAEINGKKIGSFGDLACFSFHPRKAITTGEGGLVVTQDKKIAKRLKIMRNHGIVAEDGIVDFVEAGLNYRMTDFQSALGHEQFTTLDDLIAMRLKTARLYDDLLSAINWIQLPEKLHGRKMVYQSYHIMVDSMISRDKVIAYLKKCGVETNIGAYAMNRLSIYRNNYHLKDADFPNAVAAFTRGMVLPMGSHVGSDEIQSIAEALRRVGKHRN